MKKLKEATSETRFARMKEKNFENNIHTHKDTHILDEMICVEIALGKMNRKKNGSIKIFSVLVYFYNPYKVFEKYLTATNCR